MNRRRCSASGVTTFCLPVNVARGRKMNRRHKSFSSQETVPLQVARAVIHHAMTRRNPASRRKADRDGFVGSITHKPEPGRPFSAACVIDAPARPKYLVGPRAFRTLTVYPTMARGAH